MPLIEIYTRAVASPNGIGEKGRAMIARGEIG